MPSIVSQHRDQTPVATTILVGVAAYVGVNMVSNVMSARIITLGGQSMDAGTVLYPLAFTLRDVIHKSAGGAVARRVIVVTAGLNLAMVAAFWVAAELPADTAVGPQSEFAAVLLPVWRIVVGSLVAQVVAELVDTEIYEWVVRRWGDRLQWARVLASNAVSIPLDTVVFAVIAFVGDAAGVSLWSIVASNIVVKSLTTMVTWPLIYTVGSGARPSRSPSPA